DRCIAARCRELIASWRPSKIVQYGSMAREYASSSPRRLPNSGHRIGAGRRHQLLSIRRKREMGDSPPMASESLHWFARRGRPDGDGRIFGIRCRQSVLARRESHFGDITMSAQRPELAGLNLPNSHHAVIVGGRKQLRIERKAQGANRSIGLFENPAVTPIDV